MVASYLSLEKGVIQKRVEKLKNQLRDCNICARECGVDRLGEERGECEVGERIRISSVTPHFGEESPLVGTNGSGTIFLASCNLSCVYCQNYELSQFHQGNQATIDHVAEKMLELQERGCHNINWVSPSHFVPQLVEALMEAKEQDLEIPIVYNTGGYDNPETLKLLDGIVDIYMPDIKYSSNRAGLKYSKVPDYWDVSRKAVGEMWDQVGDLTLDEHGIAQQGLLVRHLILPEGVAGTEEVLKFLAKEISEDTYVNLMKQYRPCWKASEFGELNRRITRDEFYRAKDLATELGLRHGF
ncbi:MAG: radical SAM protein [Candidatus Bipolaricaulota bacterium]